MPSSLENHSPETLAHMELALEQVPYSEEEIWKQINALRIIVGYKVVPQATCVGELKALYLVTGVEPPASLEERSDLKGVNDKLQFLKSIVGVK